MKPALILHGGCGAVHVDEQPLRLEACERAADVGWKVLDEGGSALDAVETAIRRLEDEPLLNAGTGSYLQADGVARMDASIMASSGRAGAVVQVPSLRNPIRLARYLLDQGAYVMLSGREALELALRLGHDPAVVATPAKIAYWREHMTDAVRTLDYARMAEEWRGRNPIGTVGCVAVDSSGQLAAGTSTGGTGQAYPGRVGDSPIIGAGTYCTRRAAVSMTGVGEHVLVLLSAKRLCDLVDAGQRLETAAQAVLDEIARLATQSAGVIAVDSHGTTIALRDTPFMAVARR